MLDDLIGGLSESENILLTYEFRDLHVRAVHSAQRHRAVEHELHIAGSAGFFGGQGDLLGNIRRGDQLLRHGHIVVAQHDDFEERTHLGVIVDNTAKSEDRVNDILRDHIRRCRLRAEEHRDRSARPVAVLDVQVAVDGPQKVELLPLVLVQTLDLNVVNGFRIHLVALIFLEPGGKLFLLRILAVQDALQKCGILRIGKQVHQLVRVRLPPLADLLANQLGELRIALHDPSAESDAVGLIIELLRIELVEVVELRILKDLGVEPCDAVDGVAVMDIQVRHVDVLVLVDDLHGRITVFCLHSIAHPLDDRHQVRRDGLEEMLGPCLQRLGQDRMIGIGTDIGHDLIGFLFLYALLCQKTDQLRDHERRMCVVDLDRRVIGQIMQVAAALCALVQDELRRAADHEVFLVDAEHPARLVAVVRVQEEGQVLLDLLFVKIDAGSDQSLVNGIEVEQAEAAAFAAIAGDVDLIHGGNELQVAALYFVVLIRAPHPVGHAPLAPVIGARVLLHVLEGLLEQSAVIRESHAVRGKAQRRKTVDKACGKSSQAAVSKRRLIFEFLQIRDLQPGLRQLILHVIIESQIDQVVGEELSDQELRGNIVDFLLAAVVSLILAGVLCQCQRCVVKLKDRTLIQCLSCVISQFFCHHNIPPAAHRAAYKISDS